MTGYFKIENKINELKHFAEHGLGDLKSTGIQALDEFYMIKKGYPLFVAGNPGSGKSEFIFDILMNTSILYGWKHFVYCGEGGNIEHIFNELLHKYLEKPYKYATEVEKVKSEYFVNEHFIVANHENDYTISEFYELVLKAEIEYNIKFDTTVFDPFNDIKDEVSMFGGREDKYLAYALKEARISSKKYNRTDILVNHVADVQTKIDKETGKTYLPVAQPTQWAGGRTWWRRAFVMILVYKPYSWRKDENGVPYEENEGHVIIQKFKPKGVGKKGLCRIYWDWKKNRYYCKVNGQELYSCQTLDQFHPKTLPQANFTETINEHPF